MTWYDYHCDRATGEHQFAGRDWWINAMQSGYMIDRTQMQQLLQSATL